MTTPASPEPSRRDRRVRAIAALILALVAGGLAIASVPTKRLPDAERGRNLFRENCWQCHGFTGEGAGPVASALPTQSPPLAGRLAEGDYDRLVDLILTGKGDMPSYSAVMDRHDARRILVWLGTLDPEHPHDPADDEPKDKKNQDDERSDEDAPEAGGGAEGGD